MSTVELLPTSRRKTPVYAALSIVAVTPGNDAVHDHGMAARDLHTRTSRIVQSSTAWS